MKVETWVAGAVKRAFGEGAVFGELRPMLGQASNRKHYRQELAGPAGTAPTAVVVELPPDPFVSDEASAEKGVEELPFVNVLRFLEARGVRVPGLLVDGTAEGFLLLEDLGEETMLNVMERLPESQGLWYRRSIDLLVSFQGATMPLEQGPGSGCVAYSRSFTRELLRWELDHFTEWGLQGRGVALCEADLGALGRHYDELVSELLGAPQVVVHRDFQSTNLIPVGDGLGLIDFQDALIGPWPYDLVALLRDSYVELSPRQVEEFIEYYWGLTPLAGGCTLERFRELFYLQVVQRKLKDAGRFVFIDRVKGNPRFLKYVEPTLGYVSHALGEVPGLAPLRQLLGRLVPEIG